MSHSYSKFFQLIQYYAELDHEEKQLIQDKVPVTLYKKGEYILQAGTVTDRIYFLLEGYIRLFYYVEGVDKTAFFYSEGRFFCAGESYTNGIPAKENLQAIEDSLVMSFDRELLELLINRSSKFELMARIATEDELIHYQRMIASFVTKSAEDRFLELIETNPQLFLKVPQQYIATYLGVSPETLSRIKRRVAKKAMS
ncbi:MAG: cyclic nucleotide-binding protein [Flammeovirgaceae bacterium]|nr:cyclic nucleotide-binding protein [Flammeovirgaceae bacterium]MBE61695.1 cyclic nucleotide-binding protein [Flammeovirgaceae bacterium]MBR06851.1 cyclic nucleotide-binding protein [Rickettsiales bacterium]HCX24136.1 Crp/Fnr family transcriptional regulator [Cytophagales bacterium]|tara:strand:+ start:6578 stop:7171 length:594 start_codon:yes stop_codon:yes gene_type:complete